MLLFPDPYLHSRTFERTTQWSDDWGIDDGIRCSVERVSSGELLLPNTDINSSGSSHYKHSEEINHISYKAKSNAREVEKDTKPNQMPVAHATEVSVGAAKLNTLETLASTQHNSQEYRCTILKDEWDDDATAYQKVLEQTGRSASSQYRGLPIIISCAYNNSLVHYKTLRN